jgi:hypothetical protein
MYHDLEDMGGLTFQYLVDFSCFVTDFQSLDIGMCGVFTKIHLVFTFPGKLDPLCKGG